MKPVSTTSPSFAERMRVYRPNRERFSADRLRQYVGQWVAFNAEGTDIVAAAPDLEGVERGLAERGIDPQDVVFERVDEGDICLGAAEWF